MATEQQFRAAAETFDRVRTSMLGHRRHLDPLDVAAGVSSETITHKTVTDAVEQIEELLRFVARDCDTLADECRRRADVAARYRADYAAYRMELREWQHNGAIGRRPIKPWKPDFL